VSRSSARAPWRSSSRILKRRHLDEGSAPWSRRELRRGRMAVIVLRARGNLPVATQAKAPLLLLFFRRSGSQRRRLSATTRTLLVAAVDRSMFRYRFGLGGYSTG